MIGHIDWNKIIEKWRSSGKKQRAFCQDEGLSYWTFRDKLKARKKNGLVRITKEKKTNNILSGHIELIIDKRIQITLNVGYSGDLLRAVLSDLGIAQ
jgi:hypothetical protein